MRLRSSIFAFFVLAACPLLAQGNSSEHAEKTSHLKQGSTRIAASGYVDTRLIFPQISSSIQQRPIQPENPTRRLGIKDVGSLPKIDQVDLDVSGPREEAKFPGIDMTNAFPADPDIAVGPAHIVQVVNTRIAFFTKAGFKQADIDGLTFFAPVRQTTFVFDPKVNYDRIAQRWVVIMDEQDSGSSISNLLFAVSDDSDPNGVWFLYRIPAAFTINGFLNWLDYPSLGYNKDGYVIAGNEFGFQGNQPFRGFVFLIVPKAPVLTGSPVTVTSIVDTSGFGSTQVAETVDPTKDTVFAASRAFTNQTRFYGIRGIAGTPVVSILDVAATSGPASPNTALSTSNKVLATVGSRIFTAIWRNGRMYLSYNVGQGTSIVASRWAEYSTGNWPVSGTITELQAGNIASATINQFMPAINVNKWGDVGLIFTQCNSSITSNLAVVGRISTDPANSISSPTVLATATGNSYLAPQGRWGDYFGVDVDPIDDETFWGTGMVVRADNLWTTHILSWSVSKTANLAPATGSWVRGVVKSGTLADLAANDSSYFAASAGLVLFASEPPAQLQVGATAPSGTVLSLDLTVVAKTNTIGLTQRVQLWNWVTGTWVNAGQQLSTTSNSIQSVSATGTLSDYVEAGTRNMLARIQWFQSGLILLWPWTASADQVQWTIRTR